MHFFGHFQTRRNKPWNHVCKSGLYLVLGYTLFRAIVEVYGEDPQAESCLPTPSFIAGEGPMVKMDRAVSSLQAARDAEAKQRK